MFKTCKSICQLPLIFTKIKTFPWCYHMYTYACTFNLSCKFLKRDLKKFTIPNIHNKSNEFLLDCTLELGKEKKKQICSKRG